MKGVIFTEFIDMVEETYGLDVVDRITSIDGLKTNGAYTTVGNYPHEEMLGMIDALSKHVGASHHDLMAAFGKRLFSLFYSGYPAFFVGIDNALDFLNGIETAIHADVRKLYPDAVLPIFDCQRPEEGTLIMEYSSTRPMASLAESLINVTVKHYGEDVRVSREAGPSGDDCSARFTLVRKA